MFVSKAKHTSALAEIDFLRGQLANEYERGKSVYGESEKHLKKYIDAQKRLDRIAALETPNCAHGVRKAARIARGEL